MPAIRFVSGFKSTSIKNHYRDNFVCTLQMRTPEGKLPPVNCIGFICTQGSKYLEGAELGTIKAVAYTNGDGEEGSEWRLLADGELVYCMVLPIKQFAHRECYILVDDAGWPILAGDHPYRYMPARSEFSDPGAFQHSGTSHFAVK